MKGASPRIARSTGITLAFPNHFFCDSWVLGLGGDHSWQDAIQHAAADTIFHRR